MPAEATEQAGPIVVWRKELRPDSGGPGTSLQRTDERI
jgi:N-methylhydantoinase B